MAKETKVGLLIGLALILLVGIILSDLVSGPAPSDLVEEQAAGFSARAQNDIYAAPAPGATPNPRSLERPTLVNRGTAPSAAAPAVPDSFRTQPPFGQEAGANGNPGPGSPLILPGRDVERTPSDAPLAPPPARRPDLPEPDTREASGPQVTQLPQAWRVDRRNVPPAAETPGPSPATSLANAAASPSAAAPPVPATPEDRSFFIPPPQTSNSAPDPGSDHFHVVGPRDSLAAVARQHYGSPAYATGIGLANPGLIGFGGTLRPGDRLVLPPPNSPLFRNATPTPPRPVAANEPEPLPPAAPPRSTANAPAGTITVAAGDTLSGLAVRYLGNGQRWDDLLAANTDVLQRPEGLRVGMVLRLPATSDRGAPAPPAALTAAPGPSATSGAATYTVRAGDNLTRIAARALGDGQRWDDIFAANRDQLDNPGQVREGMKLVLPGVVAATPSAAPAGASPAPAASSRTYTVKAGDNLTRIAARALGDGQRWDDIFAANRDALDAPESIRVGQILRLP